VAGLLGGGPRHSSFGLIVILPRRNVVNNYLENRAAFIHRKIGDVDIVLATLRHALAEQKAADTATAKKLLITAGERLADVAREIGLEVYPLDKTPRCMV
jgi:hypothetical protein